MITFKTNLLIVQVWAGLPRMFLRMSILWSPYSLTDFTTLYFVSVEQGQSPVLFYTMTGNAKRNNMVY